IRLMKASSGEERDRWRKELLDFASFSSHIQSTSDLGEPKFFVDGHPYTDPWCRPQSDGPALRAIALMQFTIELIRENQAGLAASAVVPVVNRDINYVLSAWRLPTCDLWEEVSGDHFYTRMVQRRALVEAAGL